MRRCATREDIGKKAWFSDEGNGFTDVRYKLIGINEGVYIDEDGCGWRHCEVECEVEKQDEEFYKASRCSDCDSLIIEGFTCAICENAKLKAELAELKKGEPETRCPYLVADSEGDELVMWLTKDKKWSSFIGENVGVYSAFSHFTIKERLYKKSEVSGE